MTRARLVRRRAWLRAALLAAAAGSAVVAGWRMWLLRLPRPDLLAYVPADAAWVLQLRRAPEALDRLARLDPEGALTGPGGLLASALRAKLGAAGRVELVRELARDEALAAGWPGGAFVLVSRTGAREEAADLLARGLAVVARASPGGGALRRVRLRGAGLSYALTGGVLVLSTRPEVVLRSLAAAAPRAAAGPVPSGVAGLALSPVEGFDLRFALLRPPPSAGWLRAAEARATIRAGITAHVRLEWSGSLAGRLAPYAAAWPRREIAGLAALPADALAAAGVSALGPAWRLATEAGARPPDVLAREAARLGLPAEIRRLEGGDAAVALLGVDRAGVLPMPQFAAAAPDHGGAFDEGFLLRLDAALRAGSSGLLSVTRTALAAADVRVVNFPVTRTLAPALARARGRLVLGSSVSALGAALDTLAGRRPSLAARGPALLRAPAQFALVLDAPALAAEAREIVEGLRAYRLLAPAAEARWTRDVAPWLDAAGVLGVVAVAGNVEADGTALQLDAATSESAAPPSPP